MESKQPPPWQLQENVCLHYLSDNGFSTCCALDYRVVHAVSPAFTFNRAEVNCAACLASDEYKAVTMEEDLAQDQI